MFKKFENGVRVMSVIFGDDLLEIQFVEERDESDDVIDIKQRLISTRLFQDQIAEVKELLADILDSAAIHRRKPVERFIRTPENIGD